MANQATELVKTQRVKRILDMMGRGMYSYEIVATLEKEWNCSNRSVYKYMNIVKKILAKEVNKDANDLLNKFNNLYEEARKRGDIKTANAILANMGKFTVGEKTNVEHSGSITGFDINIIPRKDENSN